MQKKEAREKLLAARRYLRSAIKSIQAVHEDQPFDIARDEAISAGRRAEGWLNEAIDAMEDG